jgi:hypothetical protein
MTCSPARQPPSDRLQIVGLSRKATLQTFQQPLQYAYKTPWLLAALIYRNRSAPAPFRPSRHASAIHSSDGQPRRRLLPARPMSLLCYLLTSPARSSPLAGAPVMPECMTRRGSPGVTPRTFHARAPSLRSFAVRWIEDFVLCCRLVQAPARLTWFLYPDSFCSFPFGGTVSNAPHVRYGFLQRARCRTNLAIR